MLVDANNLERCGGIRNLGHAASYHVGEEESEREDGAEMRRRKDREKLLFFGRVGRPSNLRSV